MNQTGGLTWFQVLPVQNKASLSLQFNCVHMLPEEKFPFDLPIETFLKNHESNERKIERRNIRVEVEEAFEARQTFTSNAKAQGPFPPLGSGPV